MEIAIELNETICSSQSASPYRKKNIAWTSPSALETRKRMFYLLILPNCLRLRKEEVSALSGPNEFAEFYMRLKGLKEFHKKHPNEVA